MGMRESPILLIQSRESPIYLSFCVDKREIYFLLENLYSIYLVL